MQKSLHIKLYSRNILIFYFIKGFLCSQIIIIFTLPASSAFYSHTLTPFGIYPGTTV